MSRNESEHPNVLMVVVDQHNASLMGCVGDKQVITPNLDRFAKSSVNFTNAYAQNTICTPSRVSLMSGQYCHNHGYYGLSGPANFGLNNFMRHFKANGYRTAAYGKLHLPESPHQWIANDLDEYGDSYVTADGSHGESEYFDELERLGIRDLEDSWLSDSGVYGDAPIVHDAMPSKLPYKHTQEVWCAQKAMKFIEASGEDPFCVKVSLQRPHHPLLPQKQFWDLYPEDIELPPTAKNDPGHRPPHFRKAWKEHHAGAWPYSEPNDDFEKGEKRHWRGTLACITQMDDVFGMMLDYLEENNLSENTIVIYTSDHGAYHGIHGIREKAPGICSNAVCRIPLLWRAPSIVASAGTVQDAFVESVDLAPTLSALCGLSPMESVDGLNIRLLLEGGVEKVRDVAVTENVWSKSLRWKNFRYVHYPLEMFDGEDVGELYDLESDPDETMNLYDKEDNRETRDKCRCLLADWLITTTRCKTTHPTVISTGTRNRGRVTYPLCSDGTAPNSVQPRFRDNNATNYL